MFYSPDRNCSGGCNKQGLENKTQIEVAGKCLEKKCELGQKLDENERLMEIFGMS